MSAGNQGVQGWLHCCIFQPPASQGPLATSESERAGETTDPAEMLTEEAASDDHPSGAAKWPLAHVRQNFGKISVAPQFLQEDLVPVDILGTDETESDLEDEAGEQQPQQQQGPCQRDRAASGSSCQAGPQQDSKAVLQSLEEKIAKCKKFLEKARAKRFSAIRWGLFWNFCRRGGMAASSCADGPKGLRPAFCGNRRLSSCSVPPGLLRPRPSSPQQART